MTPAEFLERVRQAASAYSWITALDAHIVGQVARARLRLKPKAFIDVYYNAQTGSISFAYIERGHRLFGANNMKIGWHIHPFGDPQEHRPSSPLTVQEFLELLAQELGRQGKI